MQINQAGFESPETDGKENIKMFRYAHTNIIAKDYRKLVHFYKEVFRCKTVGEKRELSGAGPRAPGPKKTSS